MEPVPVYTAAGMPCRSLGELPAADPSATSAPHGKAGPDGVVTIEVSAACVVTIFVKSERGSGNWVLPGSSSASYQKTFAAAGLDYFVLKPGTKFFVRIDSGTITGYTDALRADGVTHG